MFQNGLVDEVRELMPIMSKQAAEAVGYKEVIAYLNGDHDLDHAANKRQRNLVQRATAHARQANANWYRRASPILNGYLQVMSENVQELALEKAREFLGAEAPINCAMASPAGQILPDGNYHGGVFSALQCATLKSMTLDCPRA